MLSDNIVDRTRGVRHQSTTIETSREARDQVGLNVLSQSILYILLNSHSIIKTDDNVFE